LEANGVKRRKIECNASQHCFPSEYPKLYIEVAFELNKFKPACMTKRRKMASKHSLDDAN